MVMKVAVITLCTIDNLRCIQYFDTIGWVLPLGRAFDL